jgi:hypothetical protein
LSVFDEKRVKKALFLTPLKKHFFKKWGGKKHTLFRLPTPPSEIGGYKNTLLTQKGLKYPTLFSILPSSPNEIGIFGGVPDFDPFFSVF